MVDGRFSDRNVGQLLSDDMGRVSHGYVLTCFERPGDVARLCNLRMTLGRKIFIDDLMADTPLGRTTLPGRVLGANRRDSDDCGHLRHHWISRYGCGILKLGYHPDTLAGPSFWDQGILTVTGLEGIGWIGERVPNVGMNVGFMIFGAVALAFNIVTRWVYTLPFLSYLSATFTPQTLGLLNLNPGPNSYSNVYKSRVQSGQSPFTPLLYLLPFPGTVLMQILWLSHPTVGDSAIIYSESLVPFLCAWGLVFAHQVGRIILAHVTKTEFPLLDFSWIWSVIGAVDVNLPRIIGR